jgi:hypothetical protein
MYKLVLISIVILSCTGCSVQGEVYPWRDTEGSGGITNEIKF